MSEPPRSEQNIFSEVAKAVLGSQFDDFRNLAVSAQTNLLKLIQGEVDDISFQGRNLVKDDLQIKEIEIQTDQISVDPLSILLGKIRLNESIDSHIHLVLSENNLNQNMNSDYILGFLKPIDLNVEGEINSLELQPPFAIKLLENNKMRFTGNATIRSIKDTQKLAFTAVVSPRTDTQPVRMETFCCTPDDGQSIPFMIALLQWMNSLVSQPYVEFGGIAFQVKQFVIQNKEVITDIEIHAAQIPDL
ncbi:LmeA family phospholipid-binding protein [Leptolyngbya sp. AN03gr2]|uniref:LmeA family phospholipid-binding protein n=1 Tax=unclassified Leptolyngbya TaxID=2650499 RepID=UPI003D322D9E